MTDPGISKPWGEVDFFGSGNCFDAPLLTPYAFVVSVENKIDIVNIAY